MKEVLAVIRMNKINETKKALEESGYISMTCRKVYGRGKKKVNFEMIEGLVTSDLDAPPKVLESISEAHRLIAKRLLTMIVNDEDVAGVVKTIIEVNKTGNMGDGKIFVLPIVEAIRIRTGERGTDAI